MNFQESQKSILQKLAYLKTLTLNPCASNYREKQKLYQTKLRLTEEEVAHFEKENGIRLPEEYRYFITQIGNGGPGPQDNELLSLSPCMKDPTLALPCPLFEKFPEFSSEPEELIGENEYEKRMVAWLDQVKRSLQGTLPLVIMGDSWTYHLVLQGPKRGTIWLDGTGSDSSLGITEESPNFLTWYEDWVDQEIKKIRGWEQTSQKAIKNHPSDWLAHYNRAFFLGPEGFAKEAQEFHTSLFQKEFSYPELHQMQLSYFRRHQDLVHLQKAIDQAKPYGEITDFLAGEMSHAYWVLGEREKAKNWMEKATTLFAIDRPYQRRDYRYQDLANMWLRLGEIQKASEMIAYEEVSCERLLEEFNQDKQYQIVITLCHEFKRKLWPWERYPLAVAYAGMQKWEQALLHYQTCYQNKDTSLEVIHMLMRRMSYEDALALLATEEAWGTLGFNLLGCLCFHVRLYEMALFYFTKAYGLDYQKLPYHLIEAHLQYILIPYANCGITLLLLGRLQEANTILSEVRKCDPTYPIELIFFPNMP